MEKTLHGKRHVRARKSVRIGREKKRAKKYPRMFSSLDKLARVINNIDLGQMVDAIENATVALASASMSLFEDVGKNVPSPKDRR